MQSLVTRRQALLGAGGVGLGLLAGCGRLPWQAAPTPRMPRVGVFTGVSADAGPAALRQGLRELGYAEGENITVDIRSSDGRPDLYPTRAAELLQSPADVVVVGAAPEVRAIRQVSDSVPVVFAYA